MTSIFTSPALDRVLARLDLRGRVELIATPTGAQWALIGPTSAPGTTLLGKTIPAARAALARIAAER